MLNKLELSLVIWLHRHFAFSERTIEGQQRQLMAMR